MEMNEEAIFAAAARRTRRKNAPRSSTKPARAIRSFERVLSRFLRHTTKASFSSRLPAASTSPIDQPSPRTPGTQIGPYKLLQEIGQGGMGVVYMAEQHEPVAATRGPQDHQAGHGHAAGDRAVRGRTASVGA